VLKSARDWIWQTIVDWLNDIPKSNRDMQEINNFDHMSDDLRPSDVVLFEGRSRVGEVIKIITLSPWTHAGLYIGCMDDIKDPKALARVKKHYDGDPKKPLIVESLLGFGTIVSPLTDYADDNLRVCRPDGLVAEDQHKVVNFATEHLGMNYDVRQILDLARFMFPYGILPRNWRSSLFQHNAGRPTNIICSSMIARCFHSVDYPMLPLIKSDRKDRLKFHRRDFRLFVPSDFDYSPYFTILKFPAWPLSMKESYRDLPWTDEAPEKKNDKEVKKSSVKDKATDLANNLINSLSNKTKEAENTDTAYEQINLK